MYFNSKGCWTKTLQLLRSYSKQIRLSVSCRTRSTFSCSSHLSGITFLPLPVRFFGLRQLCSVYLFVPFFCFRRQVKPIRRFFTISNAVKSSCLVKSVSCFIVKSFILSSKSCIGYFRLFCHKIAVVFFFLCFPLAGSLRKEINTISAS